MPTPRTPDADAARVDFGVPTASPLLTRRALREQASSVSTAGTRRAAGRSVNARRGLRVVPALAFGLVGIVAGTGAGATVSTLRDDSATVLAADGEASSSGRDAADRGSRSEDRPDLDSSGSAPEGGDSADPVVVDPEAKVDETDSELLVVPAGMTPDDLNAGLLSRTVPDFASGELITVPGEVAAPGAGTVRTIRVEVEQNLDIDAALFADYVLATLNDPRSWGGDGSVTFARTASADAEITVTLASPDSVDKLCAPLRTNGKYSCGVTGNAILNAVRWADGSGIYGADRESFRRYLINHEVGHVLGHGHEKCGASDTFADVMVQQSGNSLSCIPNGWPNP